MRTVLACSSLVFCGINCQIERVAIDGKLAAVQLIKVAVRVFHLLASVQKHTIHIHRIDKGRARDFSVSALPAGVELFIEQRMLLAQQMFIDKILPEIVHILQGQTFGKERKARLTVYLTAVCLIADNLALEIQNARLCAGCALVRLPVLVYAGNHRREPAFVNPCGLQRILDGLAQPIAVGSACIETSVYLGDDGRYLLRNPLLLGGRNRRRAPVAEGVHIPISVMDCKRRNDLYVHTPL